MSNKAVLVIPDMSEWSKLRAKAIWTVKAFDYWLEHRGDDPQAWDSFCLNIEDLRGLVKEPQNKDSEGAK